MDGRVAAKGKRERAGADARPSWLWQWCGGGAAAVVEVAMVVAMVVAEES